MVEPDPAISGRSCGGSRKPQPEATRDDQKAKPNIQSEAKLNRPPDPRARTQRKPSPGVPVVDHQLSECGGTAKPERPAKPHPPSPRSRSRDPAPQEEPEKTVKQSNQNPQTTNRSAVPTQTTMQFLQEPGTRRNPVGNLWISLGICLHFTLSLYIITYIHTNNHSINHSLTQTSSITHSLKIVD